MLSEELEKSITIFFAKVYDRASKGATEYGDKSFERKNVQLIGELQEEIADIASWGWILWHKLEKLKTKLEQVDE